MASQSGSSTAVTLKTIADKMGVSITTVARALKDGHKVSPEMTEKVRTTADELGYVRNMDGVKLRTGKTFVIMAFLRFSSEEEIGDSGSVGLLNGIHRRLVDTNYSIRAVPVLDEDSGLERIKAVVKGRNADGLILDHTEPQDLRVRYLLEQDFPFVTFGRTELFSEHPYFDVDNEQAAYQGTTALINSGKTKLAFLDADESYLFVRQRLRGYKRALAHANIEFDSRLVRHVALEADAARDAAVELIKAEVDGFVCVNELVFLGARVGVRSVIGEQFMGIGFSVRTGTNIGEYIGSPISASYFSRNSAGWNLADSLLKSLDGEPIGNCQDTELTELRTYA